LRHRTFVASFIVVISLVFCVSTYAEPEEIDDKKEKPSGFSLNLYIENDAKRISLWGGDRNYTNGIQVSYLHADGYVPRWARFLTSSILTPLDHIFMQPGWTFNFGFTAGQQIYTPANISLVVPDPNDRPYAGWLYTGALMHFRHTEWLHSFQLLLGVIGPPSLAEQTQKWVHQILGIPKPQGWGAQLKTEPTLSLFYEGKYRLWSVNWSEGNRFIDVFPYAGASFGNVFIYAGGGGGFRIGYHLSDDFGTAALAPVRVDGFLGVSGEEPETHFFETYLFFNGEVRGVLRNIFLDGNTFVSSPSIPKRFFVLEWEMGGLIRLGRFSMAWRQVTQSPEFDQQGVAQVYGTLSFTYTQHF
jgi:lipid A 3-O-deacylase